MKQWAAHVYIVALLAAVLAGPATAQLPSGGDGSPPEPPTEESHNTLSATEPVPDEQIEERLRRVFSSVEDFEDIRVQVANGVVQLSGTTLRAEARDQAETLSSRFEGVLYVENNIEAETDVGTRLNPALRTLRAFFNDAAAYLPLLGVALLVVLLFGGLAAFVQRWEAPYERFGINPLVHDLIRRLLRVVVFLIGVVIALNLLDATALVGALLGTAGIAGLALGFAFQDIVENYLAGALLSLRQPFSADDHVLIDVHEGKVVRLTAREVVLMTLDGNHVSLPNSTVFKSVITNFTRNPRRRFDVIVGIGVEEEPPEAIAIGTETLRAMQGVMDAPEPFALVERIGDSSVVIRFYGWVDQREADFLKVRSKAVRVLKAALDEAGIELPEPIYSIRMRGQEGPPAEQPAHDQHAAPQRTAEVADRDTDISVDTQLDGQIREDRLHSEEENLLSDDH